MKLDRRAKSQQRKNREYWQQHLKTVKDHLFDVSRDEMLQKMSEHYTSALQKIRADMVDVLMKVSSGDYNMNELYKFNRYVKLQEKLNKHLKELGQAEVDIMNQGFQSFYKQVDKGVRDCLKDANVPKGSFSSVSKEAVKKAVEDIWCSDHQRWSSRIWKNKALLQQSLERGLVDCIARGTSRETLVKDLMERMGVAYYKADRIVRTELAQIQNAAAIKRYKESGTKKVKTIACKDERVCKICKKKDGKLTDIDKAGPGISHLFHPNCRCLVVPVVDVPDYSVEDMERIAQEEVARLEKRIKDTKLGSGTSDREVLGNIDPDLSEQAAEYYGDLIRKESVEHAIVIEPSGTVTHFTGTSNAVGLDGVMLDGAYIVHNHPASEGIVSFGEDDFDFLRRNQGIQTLIAVNETYTYSVRVLKDIGDLSYNEIYRNALRYRDTEDFEMQHGAFLYLEERGYIQYERKRIK